MADIRRFNFYSAALECELAVLNRTRVESPAPPRVTAAAPPSAPFLIGADQIANPVDRLHHLSVLPVPLRTKKLIQDSIDYP
jgi:hypothetical protein